MNSRLLLIWIRGLLAISIAAYGQELRLDILSDCDSLSRVQSMLQQPVSASCRPPRNQFEKRLMSQFGLTSGLSSCLLPMAPTSGLAGFSCIDLSSQGYRELLCFRPVSSGAVEGYHRDYDPAQANRYKRAAASCSATNKDASEAPNSLFPQSLNSVAKGDFGFIVGIGNSPTPLTRAYHGFGSVDPSLAIAGSGVEVFDMIHFASEQKMTTSTDRRGDWKFDILDIPREGERIRPTPRASIQRAR